MRSEENNASEKLHLELQELRREYSTAKQYIRQKVNQLLTVMGTSPLRPEELDDETLIELDPIGIVSNSFVQILKHLKKTNEQLKETHDEITAIFDSAGMGILVLDRDMRILTCNKKIEDQFEINRDAISGMACHQLLCRRDDPVDCPSRKAMVTGKSSRMDMVLNGHHFDVVATPICDGEGAISRIVLVYMDTTERILAQENLRKSEERYRDLFENSTDLIQVLGADSSIRYANRAWQKTLGYGENEISRLSIFDIIHPECLDCGPEFKSVVCGYKEGRFETMFMTKGGEKISVEGNVSAVFEDGKFTGTRGIFRDITERKRVETLIAAEREQLAVTLRSIGDGVITTDIHGKVAMINKVAEQLTGWKQDDARGASITEVFNFVDEKTGERLTCPIEQVLETPMACELESNAVLLSRDGVKRLIANSVAPILDKDNSIIGTVVVFRDITEKKKLEERVIKSEKIESLGVLAGGIAHDFNNLLQGVFGYISLAKMVKDDKKKSFLALEQAEKALQMSVRLTNQLLTFSKGGKPLKKPLDLRSLIENAAKFALSGSCSEYRIVMDDLLWQTEADEGQISQVIQNIVLNADQAMPRGGRVDITARDIDSSAKGLPQGLRKGKYIEIAIKDSGIGIPEQHLGRIFDPYFTTKERGSGLGLATSYFIIKNHDGLIEAKSDVGKGTTFFIYLPAAAVTQKGVKDKPMTAAATTRTGRILVMDDEPVIRDVAGELIQALGHTVEFAEHGEEAVEKYNLARQAGKAFDVVILDLTIRGGKGGAETIQKLKEIDDNVKGIVSSGYSDNEMISHYREQGFKAVLKKPYNVDELRRVIDTQLSD